ncbi:hypothetical protein M514_01354 [Trichuris suis]|uniref:Uncharacterized protein n=1 Tax=Trichuris suis TaxID=68888 RepID=A0A085NRY6_9BILA|nr:hypothetical protein M514_01354 [Trichuris suis]
MPRNDQKERYAFMFTPMIVLQLGHQTRPSIIRVAAARKAEEQSRVVCPDNKLAANELQSHERVFESSLPPFRREERN